jgi:hypothetical protein
MRSAGPSVTPDEGVAKRRRLEIQVLEAELARADAKLALLKALLEEAVEAALSGRPRVCQL